MIGTLYQIYSFWIHDERDSFDHVAIVSAFWYLQYYYKSSARRCSYCTWLWTDRRLALATIVVDKQKPMYINRHKLSTRSV